MTETPFSTDIHVQFRDLDPMGHVNNVVFGWYLQEARADYFDDVIGLSLPDVPTVIASLSIEYRAAINHGDAVTVEVTVPRLGKTSIPMEYAIRTNDEVAATAESVMVAYDFDAEEPRPIPDNWRTAIEANEGLDGS